MIECPKNKNGCNKLIKQIADQNIFCHNQIAAPRYDGNPFEYCPYCGEKLVWGGAAIGGKR